MVSVAGVGGRSAPVRGAPQAGVAFAWLAGWRVAFGAGWRREIDERRLFLWVPVCAGAGAVVHLTATREPSLVFALVLFLVCAGLALMSRSRPANFRAAVACAAFFGGIGAAGLRVARVDAPVIARIQILRLTGFLEEVDHRREGARFILRLISAEGLAPDAMPYRVRLTTKRAVTAEAGAAVALRARLVPPAHAALPGGYDFARDAFFAGLGGVGNVLGKIELLDQPPPLPPGLRFFAAVDRARNALAQRVERAIGGPAGAVGAAMVTGKRDFLDDPTRETIRGAGIFHIITIAGVQMTLVAGIFFWGLRRLLALSPTLALDYPIKKWAAGAAMAGAIAYDLATGARVGTERALFMTLIMLGAVIFERQAVSMRNLALAALAIVVFEPEALLGASFQLSFAAVAALVAVWETKLGVMGALRRQPDYPAQGHAAQGFAGQARAARHDRLIALMEGLRHGPAAMLLSTLCATLATASFMASDFHELSPYVLIGNPLTLMIIELFAVPGALLGTFLYPLGLDGPVWSWLGIGIDFVLWAASYIAAIPGASLRLHAFAPWAIVYLALAVLCAVLWRSLALRLLGLPLAALGIIGALSGEPFDVLIAPTGDAAVARQEDGQLAAFGRRPSLFVVEQWLRADADGRAPADAILANAAPRTVEGVSLAQKPGAAEGPRCDLLGCTALLGDGRVLSLVLDRRAFGEDCGRADIIASPLPAPSDCASELVLDGGRLRETGAVALRLDDGELRLRPARAADEDRPWSRPPRHDVARADNGAPRPRAARQIEPDGDDGPDAAEADSDPPFR